jgi:multidrug resistance protein
MPTTPTRENRVILTLWLLIFSASSQIMIIAPILPVIRDQLAMPEHLMGLLVTSYAVMVGIVAILAGPVSDRVGRRRVMLIGTVCMALALWGHALVQTYTHLFIARALAGVAGGILSGSVVSYVGDVFPPSRRGWANGWVMSGTATGQILGIPIGTLLAESAGFRTPFLMFAVFMSVTWVMVVRYLPQPEVSRQADGLSVKGMVRTYVGILSDRGIRSAVTAFFLMFVSIGVFVTYFPTWLTDRFAVDGTFVASLFVVGGVANVLTGPRMGKLSDQIGRRKLVITSTLGTGLLILVSTVLIRQSWMAYPLFFAIMVLVAMRISPFQSLLSELVGAERRGTLMSLTAALGQAGLGAGGAIAGLTYASTGFIGNSLVGAVAIFGTGYLVWRYVPETRIPGP